MNAQRLWFRCSPLSLVGTGLLAVSLLAVTGCKKDTPPAETQTEVTPAPTKPEREGRNRPPRQVDEGVEVPTEEDFEEAVEKQITASSNLAKELDALEKQIQQP